MSCNREVYFFRDNNEMANFAVMKWMSISSKAVKDKGFFSVALSGGSTPVKFYEKLSCCWEKLKWDKTHIFMADERYVPFVHKDNNYRLLKETLLDRVYSDHENIHNISIDEKTSEIAAIKYEDEIRRFFKVDEGAFPVFDLILLGIGNDGHTASLFPGSLFNREKERYVIADNSESADHDRVSITLPVINNATNIIVLVSGEHKADIVKKVIADRDPDLPASNISPVKGELLFLIEKEAGRYLDRRQYS